MKRRSQHIWSEKVIAELGAASFMTETGKVIEGNYQIGDMAPVIFDRASLRYLAAWETRKDQTPKALIKTEEEAPRP